MHPCFCSDILAATGELSTSCAQLEQDIADSELPCKDAQPARDKADEDFGANGMDMLEAIEQKGEASVILAAEGWPDAVHRCLTRACSLGGRQC